VVAAEDEKRSGVRQFGSSGVREFDGSGVLEIHEPPEPRAKEYEKGRARENG
jgi:hypothetical protein